MAEKKQAEAKVEAPEGEEAAKPKKKGKLLIILIALLLLGGGGGGAAWWFLKGKKPHDPKAAAQKKEEPEKPPIFIRLETFTVNLKKADTEDHYLQVEMQFKVVDPKADEAVKLRMPEIRNALLLLLSNKTQEELVTVEGKQKLSSDIVTQSNQIIRAKEPAKDGVVGVYFTSFVIQ
ncbi:MAG: flagellar basal body-associated protein FliL [Hydrogenophilales bacterium]|nr:flagellar basal body-associated protein FliL [Hydrogenophilales bacterium]